MPFGAGQIVYEDDLTDIKPVTYTKSVATNRNSGGTGTTLVDDPELSGITLDPGTYTVELALYFTTATTDTQAIKTRWVFTGTWGVPMRLCHGPGQLLSTAAAPPTTLTEAAMNARPGNQDQIYDAQAGSAFSAVLELCYNVVITGTGNLSLQWAQNAASVNNTTVQPNSCFRITKIRD